MALTSPLGSPRVHMLRGRTTGRRAKEPFPERLFIILFLTLNGVGTVWYLFGGRFYVPPSDEAMLWLISTNLAVFTGWLLYGLVDPHLPLPPRRRPGTIGKLSFRRVNGATLLAIGSITCVLFYVAAFHDNFVLFRMFEGAALTERDRPDVVGDVPLYYTFSIMLTGFAIPLSLALAAQQNRVKARPLSMPFAGIGLLLVCLLLLLGDKSTPLQMIFYLLFMARYDSSKRLFAKIPTFIIIFLLIYVSTKFLYGYDEGITANDSFLFESIFRRIFLINVSAMGVVLDTLILQGKVVPDIFSHIKQYIFFQIYGYIPGGVPIPYSIHTIYILGGNPFLIFLLPPTTFMLLFLRRIAMSFTKPAYYHAVNYLAFYGSIVLATGSLQDFFLRSLAPMTLIAWASKLEFSARGGGSKAPRRHAAAVSFSL